MLNEIFFLLQNMKYKYCETNLSHCLINYSPFKKNSNQTTLRSMRVFSCKACYYTQNKDP